MFASLPITRSGMTAAILTFFMLCLCAQMATARPLKFSLISKDIEDVNFITAWRGCHDAALRNGDECLHMGDTQIGYFRGQRDAIHKAIDMNVDGIAISVTNSSFIAQDGLPKARANKIPVITFDSDLENPDRHLRRTYIGPNNFEIGTRLAELLKSVRPDGARICIISGGRFDPNLNERIAGIRHTLRGTLPVPDDMPAPLHPPAALKGENGWREDERCPLFNRGDEELGLAQLSQAIQNPTLDFIVPVGDWLLGAPQRLSKIITASGPRAPKLFMATGSPTDEQEELTANGTIDGYVAIDFYRIGELVYRQLRNYALGQNVVIAEEPALQVRQSSALVDPESQPPM